MTAVSAKNWLPTRPKDGHKGTFGWSLIAAGSADYWGAPLLAAKGAYRVGAGLVALAVPERIRPTIAAQMPEATYPAVAEKHKLGVESARLLLKQMERFKSLLIGPGLGNAAEFMEVIFKANGPAHNLPPLVVDADGLNLLAQMPDWPRRLPPHTILTPHPGEMARLVGAELDDDRVNLARQKAAGMGARGGAQGGLHGGGWPRRPLPRHPLCQPAIRGGGQRRRAGRGHGRAAGSGGGGLRNGRSRRVSPRRSG